MSQPLELSPLQWHALAVAAKAASKCRDQLQAGEFTVDFALRFRGHLKVAADVTSASSEAPDTKQLIAVLLEKLNERSREKILRELPDLFEANDCQLPAADQATLDRVEKMLQRLRAKVTKTRRGAVSGLFSMLPAT